MCKLFIVCAFSCECCEYANHENFIAVLDFSQAHAAKCLQQSAYVSWEPSLGNLTIWMPFFIVSRVARLAQTQGPDVNRWVLMQVCCLSFSEKDVMGNKSTTILQIPASNWSFRKQILISDSITQVSLNYPGSDQGECQSTFKSSETLLLSSCCCFTSLFTNSPGYIFPC